MIMKTSFVASPALYAWACIAPAPGALLGGWLGDRFGLRVPLALAGLSTLAMAAVAARLPVIRAAVVMPHCGLLRSPQAP
jgi:MFS family permease